MLMYGEWILQEVQSYLNINFNVKCCIDRRTDVRKGESHTHICIYILFDLFVSKSEMGNGFSWGWKRLKTICKRSQMLKYQKIYDTRYFNIAFYISVMLVFVSASLRWVVDFGCRFRIFPLIFHFVMRWNAHTHILFEKFFSFNTEIRVLVKCR